MDLPAFFDKFRNQEKVEGYMPNRSSACKYNLFHFNLLILQMQREIHRLELQITIHIPAGVGRTEQDNISWLC